MSNTTTVNATVQPSTRALGGPGDVGVYVPDNPAILDLIARSGGQGFRSDHVRLLLHFVGVKNWMGDVDGRGFARLNAGIVRSWIQPRALRALMRCLRGEGVLLIAPHSAGHFGKGFRIAERFTGPPRRQVIEYGPLAEKIRFFRAAHKPSGTDAELLAVMERRRPLLDRFRDSLAALSLPASGDALAEQLRGQVDAGHVQYVAQCLAHGDHDGLTVDASGWRVHNIVTRTSSALRPLLLLDGRPVVEVDVGNSQPLLLAILASAQHKERLHNIMEGSGPGSALLSPSRLLSAASAFSSDTDSSGEARETDSEVRSFLRACEEGRIYELLAQDAGIDRARAKVELFRDVLFGKPYVCGRVTRAFGARWPSILAWVQCLKRKYGYKIIAQALQRLESVILLDGAAARLLRQYPDVPFLTIHDSALLVAGEAETAKAIIEEEFARWGAHPTVRVKAAGPAAGKKI